jgi:hypothetical protein
MRRRTKLPDAGQDPLEPAENQGRTLKPARLPSGGGFQRRQDFLEALTQVSQNVVAVHADAVPGSHSGNSSRLLISL